jgi:DNA-binding NarL/FixJ family response regulator
MPTSIAVAAAFTPREKEVAALLLQGLENKEMAAELSISEWTVMFHIRNLYQKIGLTGDPGSRVKLALILAGVLSK